MSTHDKRTAAEKRLLAFAVVFGLVALGIGLISYGSYGAADSPRVAKLLVSSGCCCVAAGFGGLLLWQIVKRVW
jgi:hypothetical protein